MTEHTFFKATHIFSTNDLKPTGKKRLNHKQIKKTLWGHKTYAHLSQ